MSFGDSLENESYLKDEKDLLKLTIELWNKFNSIKSVHPDEKREFADVIHNLQNLIGMRIATIEHPELFPNKGES